MQLDRLQLRPLERLLKFHSASAVRRSLPTRRLLDGLIQYIPDSRLHCSVSPDSSTIACCLYHASAGYPVVGFGDGFCYPYGLQWLLDLCNSF